MPNLRARLEHGPIARFAGAYDAISTLLAEDAGFDAIWASGLCIATALGLPDTDVVSHDAYANSVRSICASTSLPVLADCNTGFGGIDSIPYVARSLARTGVAGMCIEDKKSPRVNSLVCTTGHALESPTVFAEKLRAATLGRQNSDMAIVARLESLVAGESLQSALERARCYAEAGADALIIHSASDDCGEVFDFVDELSLALPVIVIPTTYPQLSIREASQRGIAGVIYANQILRAAVLAMRSFLRESRDADRLADCRTALCSIDEILALQPTDPFTSTQLPDRGESGRGRVNVVDDRIA
ncbi:isocitrate lyase/phosphoenolpyruvate mutase family protein [Mycobacterium sp. 1245111.1]|uniref:isocitrate lyase/phosphoenolpyruvate mutase family protein n=1 Tax=Mycobacterium sp. 1245111.1 TaxID=1834073 RepID=UPI0018D4A627|nr:isocitrate lyase/phosphoenolpyruvate mutase family protein [Mycobacterium sp. 1245111.1]